MENEHSRARRRAKLWRITVPPVRTSAGAKFPGVGVCMSYAPSQTCLATRFGQIALDGGLAQVQDRIAADSRLRFSPKNDAGWRDEWWRMQSVPHLRLLLRAFGVAMSLSGGTHGHKLNGHADLQFPRRILYFYGIVALMLVTCSSPVAAPSAPADAGPSQIDAHLTLDGSRAGPDDSAADASLSADFGVDVAPFADVVVEAVDAGATTEILNSQVDAASDGLGSDVTCSVGAASEPLFIQKYGGFSADSGASVVASLGGFVFAGSTASWDLPGGQESAGDYDFWLAKVDNSGKLLWNHTYGGSNTDMATTLVALGDGFAMAGFTQSTDLPDGSKSAGQGDFWLVRTDAAGVMLWNKTYGGLGQDGAVYGFGGPGPEVGEGVSMAALADGFVLLGTTTSTALPGGATADTAGDLWLFRTDASGSLQWSKTFGGSGLDIAAAVVAVGDGFAVGATTDSVELFDNGQIPALGDYSAYRLIRTDSNGILLWSHTYWDGGDDDLEGLVALADGFVLAGAVNPPSITNTQFADAPQLIRTDASGAVLWSKTYNLSGYVSLASAVAVGDGFALTGSIDPTAIPGGMTSWIPTDAWLLRVDSVGNLLWSRTYGGSSGDGADGVTPLANGFVLVGGTNSKDLPGYFNNGVFPNALLIRTDDWGNTACATSDPCLDYSPGACDDANACTADLCDALHNGCFHTALPDGAPCGSAKTCSNETCK